MQLDKSFKTNLKREARKEKMKLIGNPSKLNIRHDYEYILLKNMSYYLRNLACIVLVFFTVRVIQEGYWLN